MTTPGGNLSSFLRILSLTLGMFIVFAATFFIYVRAEKRVDLAYESRYQAHLLAAELRQSSDDLTRMARTYVATGAPVYKRYYQEILDIRDGRKPRPSNYGQIFWDLVLDGNQGQELPRPAVPLLDLMQRASFSKAELGLLTTAKDASDSLTLTEFAAMALIETTHPPTEASRAMAIRMLYNVTYHKAKAAIMTPISRALEMSEQRTRQEVQSAKTDASRMRLAFSAFGLLLVFLLWLTQRSLHAVLGGPVNELYMRIARLGSGDFSAAVPATGGKANSVSRWLTEMQVNLARLEQQRRQATDALRHAKTLLRNVVENVPARIFWKDRDLRYLGCNTQAAKDAGHSKPGDLIGKTDFQMAWKDRAETFRSDDMAVLDSGISRLDVEETLTTGDGSEIWIRKSKVPLRDEDSRVIGVLGLYQDITTQKQTGMALRESERRFSDLLGNVDLVAVMLDREGRITYCNDYLLRLTGWEYWEVIGRDWAADFVPPELAGQKKFILEKLLRDQPDARHYESEILTRTGARRLIHWNNSVLRSSAGDPIGSASIGEDITDRRRAAEQVQKLQEQLQEQAVRDPVTGLYNRRYLDETMGRELARAARYGHPIGVVMCDVDHFKTINDTHGHAVGDEVLRVFAELLKNTARGSDIVCRFGGEEFLLLLPDMPPDVTHRRAEQLRAALEASRITSRTTQVSVTASFGVAGYPGNGGSGDELVRAADEAMYAAKTAGRNCVVVAPAKSAPARAA